MTKSASKPQRKKGRIALITLAVLILALTAVFFVYTQDYYHADETAKALFTTNPAVKTEQSLTILSPDAANDRGVGLIFYPGGKVQETAYLPLLEQLRQNGLTCVLVRMPFRLAVFNIDAANGVYAQFPAISRWYLAGHSLGGAMASSYVEKNSDRLAGLILLGAYPVNDAALPTLAIYGSEDVKLDRTKLETVADKLEIAGGNHAYFGNYGEQEGDGTASISREAQQAQTVEAILAFIQKTA
ncbi:MAG: alpha/beta hydrolase [Clostridiaceae bacterium]